MSGMAVTRAPTRKAGPGRKRKTKITFVAVVPGSASAGTCALPVAAPGVSAAAATAAAAFVLPEVLKAQASREPARRWIKESRNEDGQAFRGNGKLTPEQEELKKLRAQIKRLEVEREIFNKATAFFAKETQ